jgi:hypothetical protein
MTLGEFIRVSDKYWLVGGPFLNHYLHCSFCYNRCYGNAVKGFWALCDNFINVCLLL